MDDFFERIVSMFLGILSLFIAVAMVGAVIGFFKGLLG